jgi:hypothetical protein
MSGPITEFGEPVDVKKADPGDVRHWSVTTLIDCVGDKGGLIHWSATEAAKAAVQQQNAWKGIAETSETEAVKWLAGARFRRPEGQRTSAELGTAVHKAIEQYTLTGIRPEVDDEVRPFIEQFDGWCQRMQPEYQASEVTVFSPTYGYAGTCDGFLTIDGVRFIFDYKTSREGYDSKGNPKTPYADSVGLQLAAYRYAELAAVWRARRHEQFRRRYYLLSEAERALAVPVPEVDTGLAIMITPDHCEAYPIRCDKDVHEYFLFTVEVARWILQESKDAMAPPLVKEVA